MEMYYSGLADGVRGGLPQPGGRPRGPLGGVGQGAQGAESGLARHVLRPEPAAVLRRSHL